MRYSYCRGHNLSARVNISITGYLAQLTFPQSRLNYTLEDLLTGRHVILPSQRRRSSRLWVHLIQHQAQCGRPGFLPPARFPFHSTKLARFPNSLARLVQQTIMFLQQAPSTDINTLNVRVEFRSIRISTH